MNETASFDSLGAKAHLVQAYSLYEKTEAFDQVLLECDIAIEINPSLVEAHNLRGVVLEKLGRKAEAIEAYKQALKLNPDFSEAKDNKTMLEDKHALLPRWLGNGIVGIVAFLAVTYILELYLLSKNHFLIWDRLLVIVLATLYTPGIIVQLFLGSTEPEPEIFNWTIRSISSLAFGYIGCAITLKRKKVLRFIAISLLPLYLLAFGVWGFLLWIGSSFY